MLRKVRDEMTCPFPNLNVATVEVWEWISNFIPHYIRDAITYSYNVLNGNPNQGNDDLSTIFWYCDNLFD